MSLETESLRRELKGELGGLRDMLVDALKRITELERRVPSAPAQDAIGKRISDDAREIERLKREVDEVRRDLAEAAKQARDTMQRKRKLQHEHQIAIEALKRLAEVEPCGPANHARAALNAIEMENADG